MRTGSIEPDRSRGRLDFDLVYGLFVLFLLVNLFLLLDPFYAGYDEFRVNRQLGPVKYVALLVAVCAGVLGLARISLTGIPRGAYAALWRGWPILALGVYIFCGSAYGRTVLDIKAGFLPLAMGVLGFPIAVILFFAVEKPYKLVATFFWALLGAGLYAAALIVVKRIEGGQAFHSEIFLIVPLAVYFFLRSTSRWFAWTVLLCMVATGLATNKYTGYLILLVTILYLVVPWAGRYLRHPAGSRSLRHQVVAKRWMLLGGIVITLLLFCAFVAFLFMNRGQYLPSGSVDIRSQLYLGAWQDFLASPVYGDAFVAQSARPLVGITVMGQSQIVTHSDILDLVAHGGLVAVLLFGFGVLRVLHPSRSGSLQVSPREGAETQGLSAVIVCGVLVALFNSPLLLIPISVMFWFALGLLSAVNASESRAIAHLMSRTCAPRPPPTAGPCKTSWSAPPGSTRPWSQT